MVPRQVALLLLILKPLVLLLSDASLAVKVAILGLQILNPQLQGHVAVLGLLKLSLHALQYSASARIARSRQSRSSLGGTTRPAGGPFGGPPPPSPPEPPPGRRDAGGPLGTGGPLGILDPPPEWSDDAAGGAPLDALCSGACVGTGSVPPFGCLLGVELLFWAPPAKDPAGGFLGVPPPACGGPKEVPRLAGGGALWAAGSGTVPPPPRERWRSTG